MGLLRNRHAEPVAGSRYRMRQRLLAVGDDYWVEHEDGRRAFRVDGKALRIRKTVRDTYGVAIAPGEDDALLLAITVCIDALGHPRD